MSLAARIRRKIDRGELPSTRPPKIIAGFGNWDLRCAACGRQIFPAQTSWDIELAAYRIVSLHVGCFGLWDAELRRRGLGR
jgi:hypothetical protein